MAQLKKVPGAVDVTSSYIEGKPEYEVVLQRDKAADLGVSGTDVSNTLLLTVGGQTVSNYAEHGEEYDVKIRAERAYRSDPEGLSLITVPSSLRGSVPVRDVVSIHKTTGPSQIDREGRQRKITITANTAPEFAQSDVQAPLERIVAGLHLPPGYHGQASGMAKESKKNTASFMAAFLLSFVFMYLVLAAQFESWLHPVTILLALPLTVPFALASVLALGGSINTFTALGLLVLFGIVKKNSILQVDHANTLRREGMPRAEAVLRSNRDRLRPILMTTIAFVAGMIPLAFSKGIGAGQSRAIATLIIGGQTLSLLLTLLATPVFYTLFDDVSAWFARRSGRARREDRGEAEVAGTAEVAEVA
jgi:multidrug efflux pump subunit AcrB